MGLIKILVVFSREDHIEKMVEEIITTNPLKFLTPLYIEICICMLGKLSEEKVMQF